MLEKTTPDRSMRPTVRISRRAETMTNRLVLIATLTIAAGLASARAQVPDAADVILAGGKVVTLDDASSVVQAVAIRDGRILAVGTNADIRQRADARTHVIELG